MNSSFRSRFDTWSKMNLQFMDTFTDRPTVSEMSPLQTIDSHLDLHPAHLITKTIYPHQKGAPTLRIFVILDLYRRANLHCNVAYRQRIVKSRSDFC